MRWTSSLEEELLWIMNMDYGRDGLKLKCIMMDLFLTNT